MSEWHFINENLFLKMLTKHGMFTAPDAHMPTSLSYTLWAYNQQIRQYNIWSIHMTYIGKHKHSVLIKKQNKTKKQ